MVVAVVKVVVVVVAPAPALGEVIPEGAVTHGVWRCACRKPGVLEGPARAGNRSTCRELDDAEGGALAPGTVREVEDDALAARATRSHTCREDCCEDRDTVACLALRTRPLAIPA